jgi:2-dehydro-3-deoxyphosphogluconate aldolase/(4S)-4-hydroxy-2-oxoglutarate aldolase
MDIKLFENQVVAILRRIDTKYVLDAAQALYDGGVRLLEITLDSPDALENIGIVKRKFAGKLSVGAGTVLTAEQARAALKAGAEFTLSPVYDRAITELVIKAGAIAIPGIFSPTEAFAAYNDGAEIVKLFPASSAGVAYVKNIQGPLPQIKIMVTGGVGAHNIAEFKNAGAYCYGIGSELASNKLIAEQGFIALAARAKVLVDLAGGSRQ